MKNFFKKFALLLLVIPITFTLVACNDDSDDDNDLDETASVFINPDDCRAEFVKGGKFFDIDESFYEFGKSISSDNPANIKIEFTGEYENTTLTTEIVFANNLAHSKLSVGPYISEVFITEQGSFSYSDGYPHWVSDDDAENAEVALTQSMLFYALLNPAYYEEGKTTATSKVYTFVEDKGLDLEEEYFNLANTYNEKTYATFEEYISENGRIITAGQIKLTSYKKYIKLTFTLEGVVFSAKITPGSQSLSLPQEIQNMMD